MAESAPARAVERGYGRAAARRLGGNVPGICVVEPPPPAFVGRRYWTASRVAMVPLLSLLAVLACCSSMQPRFYPLGISGVRDAGALPTVRDAGFNLVFGPADPPFLDSAKANGLKVISSTGLGAASDLNAALAREKVLRRDRHPALWAWCLADEPEMHLVPPADVRRARRLLERAGARKPTAVVLFQGYAAGDYANIADMTFCDRYPIPWLPLANFGQHLKMVRLALGKDKPLIAIVQAFDWKYYPEQHDEEPARLRAPTYEEIRCMTYSALAEGANGLFYYAFDDGPGRWRMQEHPETWQAVREVVREVKTRLPLFQAEHVWWPKDYAWEGNDRGFNAALLSSIDLVLLRVNKGAGTVPKGMYILAVNNTDQPHVFRFRLPAGTAGDLPVLDEDRRLPIQTGWVQDSFSPFAVHVYGPLKLPATSQQLVGSPAR